MSALKRASSRLIALFRREALDREFDQEAQSHLDLAVEDYVRHGTPKADARRLARLKFGAIEASKDAHRDSRGLPWLEGLFYDLRFALRGLCRAKAFSAAAVLTLATGIAGSTTTFALVNGVLLRPLPVRDQDRLLVAWTELRSTGETHWPFMVRDIEVIRDSSRLLERVAGVSYNGTGRLVAVENDAASYMNVAPVMGDFFAVLDMTPVIGRALTRADDVTGAENVLVITHGLWLRRYGGSPDVIGRHLIVGQRPFTIVGVMPPDAEYPHGVEAWSTVAAFTQTLTNAAFRVDVDLIARVRRGTTIEQAASELHTLVAQLDAAAPAGSTIGRTPVVRSFAQVVLGDVQTAMLVLCGAVGLVLLIASVNVANLLLMHGETRGVELAVRAALGAGRARLARQSLVESLIIALAAGLVGLAVTWWTLQGVVALIPEGLPRIDAIHMDARVVLFSIAVGFLTAAVAGLAPALVVARTDLATQLRSGGRSNTGMVAQRGRRALVVTQVALAVTVVVAAGLLTRTLLRLQAVDMGLAADRLVFVELDLPQTRYAERTAHLRLLDDTIAQLQGAPGIAAATPVNIGPFSGAGGWELPVFTAEGQSAPRAAMNPSLNLESVHPNYFETFQVPLVRGRTFTGQDRAGAPDVAIVSEDAAARTWPGEDPIGKRIKFGSVESADPWRTVVGVVKPTRYRELIVPRATLYLPAEQFIVAAHMLVLRTSSPLMQVATLVRERVRVVDPDVHVMSVTPFVERLKGPLARPRFSAFLIGAFGTVALLLAAVGVYAVMAAYVRQRNREIGIRVAIGATASDIRGLVMTEGLRLVGAGAAIGIVAAISVTRVLRGLLFEVAPTDPVTMVAATLLLIGASAIASYVPARRAARVDPIALLKTL